MVHVDQTVQSSADRVRVNLPDEADSLLGKRFSLINLWRPIGSPAYDWPLALCDYRSVDVGDGQGGDTFPVSLIFPQRVGETLGVRYNAKHQWKYVFGMEPEEYVLIKWCASLCLLLNHIIECHSASIRGRMLLDSHHIPHLMTQIPHLIRRIDRVLKFARLFFSTSRLYIIL